MSAGRGTLIKVMFKEPFGPAANRWAMQNPADLSSSLALLLRVWLLVGFQSFGGGATTLFLIRRAVVDEQNWLDDAEFTRINALCHVTPGINLIALTVLIGRRVRGWPGVCVSLAGLLLPAALITVLLTAGYAHVRDLPAARAALRGIVPATVGLGLLTAERLARPLIAASRSEGNASLLLGIALLAGSALAVALWRIPVFAVLFAAGAASALFHARRRANRQ